MKDADDWEKHAAAEMERALELNRQSLACLRTLKRALARHEKTGPPIGVHRADRARDGWTGTDVVFWKVLKIGVGRGMFDVVAARRAMGMRSEKKAIGFLTKAVNRGHLRRIKPGRFRFK